MAASPRAWASINPPKRAMPPSARIAVGGRRMQTGGRHAELSMQDSPFSSILTAWRKGRSRAFPTTLAAKTFSDPAPSNSLAYPFCGLRGCRAVARALLVVRGGAGAARSPGGPPFDAGFPRDPCFAYDADCPLDLVGHHWGGAFLDVRGAGPLLAVPPSRACASVISASRAGCPMPRRGGTRSICQGCSSGRDSGENRSASRGAPTATERRRIGEAHRGTPRGY